ncbi:MAG: (deoxy)nucleoside triphosphate pyrophosphohydrolase [Bdellovibrionota bacterium]
MRSPEKEFIKSIQVVGAVILEPDETKSLNEKKILLVQRAKGDSGEGLWEFPGGKIEIGESKNQALMREIDEELNLQIEIIESLGELVHHYPLVAVQLEIFISKIKSGDLILREHQAKKWIRPEEILETELLEADRPFVQRLIQYLK